MNATLKSTVVPVCVLLLNMLAMLFMTTATATAAQPVTLDMLPKVTLTRPAPVQPGGSFVLQGSAQASAGLASAEAYLEVVNRIAAGRLQRKAPPEPEVVCGAV